LVVDFGTKSTTCLKITEAGSKKESYTVKREGAVEGRSDNWGEVVTR